MKYILRCLVTFKLAFLDIIGDVCRLIRPDKLAVPQASIPRKA